MNNHQLAEMQRPEIKYKVLPTGLFPMEGQQKKYNAQSDLRALLGKSCEVEKMMRFLKETKMFEEI